MFYTIKREKNYDFLGESYSAKYPNLHKYPATMLPQIGIKVLDDLNIKKGRLLDPYCGSGTSCIIGIDRGLQEIHGFDINPLAILISKAKFTKIDLNLLDKYIYQLRMKTYDSLKDKNIINKLEIPSIVNINYWFSKNTIKCLALIKTNIYNLIPDELLRRLFLVAFSETVRECSYTKNNEFKLYKIKENQLLLFNPDVIAIYFHKLDKVVDLYKKYYYPNLHSIKIKIKCEKFKINNKKYDVVLTSPPYGDSKTTVAYGQFSTLANEWLDISYARKIDQMLMGGKTAQSYYEKGVMRETINKVKNESKKRALEVSSFYKDLENSIQDISQSVNKGGKIIYIVGNRRVKNIQLPTDQFVAEKFEENSCKHLITYERLLSNKAMPSKNSPTNKKNAKINTMTKEYIVICEKMKH